MDVSSQQFYQEMKSARQKLLTPRTSVRVIETAAQGIFTVCAFRNPVYRIVLRHSYIPGDTARRISRASDGSLSGGNSAGAAGGGGKAGSGTSGRYSLRSLWTFGNDDPESGHVQMGTEAL